MSKTTQNSIKWTCNEIRDLLVSKNQAYGDSAIEPDNIFSKLDNAQAICARIDDKLSRIKNVGLGFGTQIKKKTNFGTQVVSKKNIKLIFINCF